MISPGQDVNRPPALTPILINKGSLMFTLNDLFDIAARMEKNGKAVYLRAMENTKDRELLDLLKWMADEEDRHRQWFLKHKGLAAKGEEDLESMIPDVIREMMGENSLSLDEVDFGMIQTPVQMLKTFVMFENDTLLFYEFLETFLDSDEAKQGLKKILEEEAAHVDKLNLMIQSYPGSH